MLDSVPAADGKMNPTIWTAKARVTDSTRRCVLGKGCTNKRGVTFARWGGLGQHRYQHGFSGDVHGLTWANLAYQAYFSATAVMSAYEASGAQQGPALIMQRHGESSATFVASGASCVPSKWRGATP